MFSECNEIVQINISTMFFKSLFFYVDHKVQHSRLNIARSTAGSWVVPNLFLDSSTNTKQLSVFNNKKMNTKLGEKEKTEHSSDGDDNEEESNQKLEETKQSHYDKEIDVTNHVNTILKPKMSQVFSKLESARRYCKRQ